MRVNESASTLVSSTEVSSVDIASRLRAGLLVISAWFPVRHKDLSIIWSLQPGYSWHHQIPIYLLSVVKRTGVKLNTNAALMHWMQIFKFVEPYLHLCVRLHAMATCRGGDFALYFTCQMDDGKFGKSGLNLNTTYNDYSSVQTFAVLYSFFWMIFRRLICTFRRFGTRVNTTYEDGRDSVPKRWHIKLRHRRIAQKKDNMLEIIWLICYIHCELLRFLFWIRNNNFIKFKFDY
jgi:hypothetical protein